MNHRFTVCKGPPGALANHPGLFTTGVYRKRSKFSHSWRSGKEKKALQKRCFKHGRPGSALATSQAPPFFACFSLGHFRLHLFDLGFRRKLPTTFIRKSSPSSGCPTLSNRSSFQPHPLSKQTCQRTYDFMSHSHCGRCQWKTRSWLGTTVIYKVPVGSLIKKQNKQKDLVIIEH